MAQSVAQPAVDAALITLAAAMRLQLAHDPAGQRAVDRAIEHLQGGITYDFDGVELRVTSWSRRAAGAVQVTDGLGCTCESARRPWCWHRACFHLLLAELALRDPATLRWKILEQCRPVDLPADSIFDY